MMVISLEIDNFRNLQKAKLSCSPGLNLILGENASGKTSLLEALYYLGRARSFRTRRPQELIYTGQNDFRIVAMMSESEGGRIVPVGIQHSAQSFSARIDGSPARSLAQLALQVPVLLLNPDSHRLLEGGPQQRRRFMDWGLFHRGDGFLTAWKRYGVALRNRNAALRSRLADRGIDAWDQELVLAAATLDPMRNTFCKALEEALAPLIEATLGRVALKVDYRRGWTQEQDLLDLLRASRNQDKRYGHTRVGPHRADFVVKVDGRAASEHLSRGQQKLLVIALVLAQACLYRIHKDQPCILLVDDLPAELDNRHRDKVMACLAGLDLQLFITAIEEGLLDTSLWQAARVLRMDQGRVMVQ